MCAYISGEGIGLTESTGVFGIRKKLYSVLFENRLLGRQRPGFLVFAGQLASFNLAGFYVGLIEWINSDDRSRDRSRNLPAEEFLAEIISVGHGNANYRVSGFFKRSNFLILRGIRLTFEPQICKHAVVAVNLDGSETLAIDRNNTFSQLASGFRKQLFEPRTEIINCG